MNCAHKVNIRYASRIIQVFVKLQNYIIGEEITSSIGGIGSFPLGEDLFAAVHL